MFQKFRQIFSANSSIDVQTIANIDQSYQEPVFFNKRVNKSAVRDNNDLRGRIKLQQQQNLNRSATPMTQSTTSSSQSSQQCQRTTKTNRTYLEIPQDNNYTMIKSAIRARSPNLSLAQYQNVPVSISIRNDPNTNIIAHSQYNFQSSNIFPTKKEKVLNSRFRSPFRFNRVILNLKAKRTEDLNELFIEQYEWQQTKKQKCSGANKPLAKSEAAQGKLNEDGDFLQGHEISHYYRSKMVDWMFSVFSNFQKSESESIFMAVSILDRFLKCKQREHASLGLQELHLYGITSILMSSKMNDIVPIFLKQLVEEAAHNKLTREQILNAEIEILQALQFMLLLPNIFLNSATKLKENLFRIKSKITKRQSRILKIEQNQIESMVEFLSKLSLLDYRLCMLNDAQMTDAIVISAIGIRFFQKLQSNAIDQTPSFKNGNIIDSLNQQQGLDDIDEEIAFLQYVLKEYSNINIINGKLLTPIIRRLLKLIHKLTTGQLKFQTLLKVYPQYQQLLIETDEFIKIIQQVLI